VQRFLSGFLLPTVSTQFLSMEGRKVLECHLLAFAEFLNGLLISRLLKIVTYTPSPPIPQAQIFCHPQLAIMASGSRSWTQTSSLDLDLPLNWTEHSFQVPQTWGRWTFTRSGISTRRHVCGQGGVIFFHGVVVW
jgi:hypothetical protein